MKKLIRIIQLKLQGYNKEQINIALAIEGLITFEQYEKYVDKKVMKGGNK